MPFVAKQRVRFGPFELDAHAGELYKHDLKLKLQGHPIQIIAMLLERPGELITREEIQQKLWPSESETFVDFEHGLNTAVRKLRQALGDEAETPQYIETLPRRGYRFVGAVADSSVPAAEGPEENCATFGESAEETGWNRRKRLTYRPLVVLICLPVLLGVAAWLLRWTRGASGGLVVTATRQLTYLGAVNGRILTDGHRIYFSTWGKNPLQYVSVNGGEATAIPSPVSRWAFTLHLSGDGSYLLVKELYGARGGFEAPIWLVDVNSGAARKLGDIEAQDAAFAPDGKTIVVAKDRALYLTDLQGSTPVKLAEAPGKAFWPRWSPDGQRLRFSVWDSAKVHATLWELRRDGSLQQVFAGWKKEGWVSGGDWTADGRYYLFLGDGRYSSVRVRSWLSSSEPTSMTAMGGPILAGAPSPVGNTIYVSVELGAGGDSFEWDLTPNHIPSIRFRELKAFVFDLSHDGQWIAYSHKTPAGFELWRARADGTQKLQLTTPFSSIMIGRYSPDGRKIAITANRVNGPWKNYWVSAEGGALHEIPSPPAVQADPVWSPDSQSILFGVPPELLGGGGPEVVRHLYLYDLRTGKTTEVPGSTGLFSPRWSPDGRYVVAMSADLQGLSLLDTTTSQWRALTAHQSTNNPFWSLDSAWVYFNDVGDTGVWRVHVPDGRVEALGPIPRPSGYSDCFAFGFAPNGAALVGCSDSRADIFALDYKEQK